MSRVSNLVLAAIVGAFAGYTATRADDIAQAAKDAAAAMKARNDAARAQFLNAVQTSDNPEVVSILGRSDLGAEFTMEQFFGIPLREQLAVVSLVFGEKASKAFEAARKDAK